MEQLRRFSGLLAGHGNGRGYSFNAGLHFALHCIGRESVESVGMVLSALGRTVPELE